MNKLSKVVDEILSFQEDLITKITTESRNYNSTTNRTNRRALGEIVSSNLISNFGQEYPLWFTDDVKKACSRIQYYSDKEDIFKKELKSSILKSRFANMYNATETLKDYGIEFSKGYNYHLKFPDCNISKPISHDYITSYKVINAIMRNMPVILSMALRSDNVQLPSNHKFRSFESPEYIRGTSKYETTIDNARLHITGHWFTGYDGGLKENELKIKFRSAGMMTLHSEKTRLIIMALSRALGFMNLGEVSCKLSEGEITIMLPTPPVYASVSLEVQEAPTTEKSISTVNVIKERITSKLKSLSEEHQQLQDRLAKVEQEYNATEAEFKVFESVESLIQKYA